MSASNLQWFDLAPAWAREMYASINNQLQYIASKGDQIMAQVQVDQAALDALASDLEAVKSALSTEIDNLKVQLPQADLSGLTAALSDLQGLEPPAPAGP